MLLMLEGHGGAPSSESLASSAVSELNSHITYNQGIDLISIHAPAIDSWKNQLSIETAIGTRKLRTADGQKGRNSM